MHNHTLALLYVGQDQDLKIRILSPDKCGKEEGIPYSYVVRGPNPILTETQLAIRWIDHEDAVVTSETLFENGISCFALQQPHISALSMWQLLADAETDAKLCAIIRRRLSPSDGDHTLHAIS